MLPLLYSPMALLYIDGHEVSMPPGYNERFFVGATFDGVTGALACFAALVEETLGVRDL